MKKYMWLFLLLITTLIMVTSCTKTEDKITEFAQYLIAGDFLNASYYVSCYDGYPSNEAIMKREDYLKDIVKREWADNMKALKDKGIFIKEMKLTEFEKVDSEECIGYTKIKIVDGDNIIDCDAKLYLALMPPAQWTITKFVFEQVNENESLKILEQALNKYLTLPPSQNSY